MKPIRRIFRFRSEDTRGGWLRRPGGSTSPTGAWGRRGRLCPVSRHPRLPRARGS